jgi:hypothetical protein
MRDYSSRSALRKALHFSSSVPSTDELEAGQIQFQAINIILVKFLCNQTRAQRNAT